MSWEDQGRQDHGEFGHGTSAHPAGYRTDDESELSKNAFQVSHCIVASLPQKLRQRAESQKEHSGTARRLRETLVAWAKGRRLNDDAFARVFFDRTADNPVEVKLRKDALATAAGDIRGAAANVAEVIQHLGLDNWPRFLADAEIRAQAPNTVAEVAQSQAPPNLKKDAIQPVYPLETAIGVAAGGIAGGVAGAARAAGAAIVRQFKSGGDQTTEFPAPSTQKTVPTPGKPDNAPETPPETSSLKIPNLPANPDELLSQGWTEISRPEAVAAGHRTFLNPKTGRVLRFDIGKPNAKETWKRVDHYHLDNPNSSGKRDQYLDKSGRPAPRGSKPSHLPPGS